MKACKKIFILVGDPNTESLCSLLAREYESSARSKGFEVRYTHLADVSFDPILHKGYRVVQTLEPGLKKIQEDMIWADHLVICYPVWWASTPSLLKALFDRIWVPGFAFHFKKKGLGWLKYLSGRSCRIIQTSGSSWWFIFTKFGNPSRILRKAILEFAGIKPIKVSWFDSVNKASSDKIERIKKAVRELGAGGL